MSGTASTTSVAPSQPCHSSALRSSLHELQVWSGWCGWKWLRWLAFCGGGGSIPLLRVAVYRRVPHLSLTSTLPYDLEKNHHHYHHHYLLLHHLLHILFLNPMMMIHPHHSSCAVSEGSCGGGRGVVWRAWWWSEGFWRIGFLIMMF